MHRDTGRSSRSLTQGYPLADLASDALRVLDAFDVRRAHIVGTGLGGLLTQLMLDHHDRLLSATLLCSTALPGPAVDLPGPDPAPARMLAEIDDPRDARAELAWRVAHRRLLHGTATPFDGRFFRARERRVIAHGGTDEPSVAHVHAATTGLDRGRELAGFGVATLVVEAPEDPVHPPPHAEHLAAALGGAPAVRIPGMGHAIGPALTDALAAAMLGHVACRV